MLCHRLGLGRLVCWTRRRADEGQREKAECASISRRTIFVSTWKYCITKILAIREIVSQLCRTDHVGFFWRGDVPVRVKWIFSSDEISWLHWCMWSRRLAKTTPVLDDGVLRGNFAPVVAITSSVWLDVLGFWNFNYLRDSSHTDLRLRPYPLVLSLRRGKGFRIGGTGVVFCCSPIPTVSSWRRKRRVKKWKKISGPARHDAMVGIFHI